MTTEWLTPLSDSVWLFPALFALTVADAVLVILPSEIAVAALAALWASTGSPSLAALIAVAAAAAIVGDSLSYALGRFVGTDRWRWQRHPRMVRALARAERTIHRRAAVLIFTARYVPYARIAVNLTAGSTRLSYWRFLPLSAAAGVAWALYHSFIGAFIGVWFQDNPLVAVVLTIIGAIAVGVLVDALIARVTTRRATASRAPGRDPASSP